MRQWWMHRYLEPWYLTNHKELYLPFSGTTRSRPWFVKNPFSSQVFPNDSIYLYISIWYSNIILLHAEPIEVPDFSRFAQAMDQGKGKLGLSEIELGWLQLPSSGDPPQCRNKYRYVGNPPEPGPNSQITCTRETWHHDPFPKKSIIILWLWILIRSIACISWGEN